MYEAEVFGSNPKGFRTDVYVVCMRSDPITGVVSPYIIIIEFDEYMHSSYKLECLRMINISRVVYSEFWKEYQHLFGQCCNPHIVFLRVNTTCEVLPLSFMLNELKNVLYGILNGYIPVYPCITILGMFYEVYKSTLFACRCSGFLVWCRDVRPIQDYTAFIQHLRGVGVDDASTSVVQGNDNSADVCSDRISRNVSSQSVRAKSNHIDSSTGYINSKGVFFGGMCSVRADDDRNCFKWVNDNNFIGTARGYTRNDIQWPAIV